MGDCYLSMGWSTGVANKWHALRNGEQLRMLFGFLDVGLGFRV